MTDDGQIDPARSATHGFGLLGMTERAQLLGGTLRAGPAPEGGWTVDAELRRRGLEAAPPLAEVATPAAAKHEALAHSVPVLLSTRVLKEPHWAKPPVDGLRFPRTFVLVLPAAGTPTEDVTALMDRMRAALA